MVFVRLKYAENMVYKQMIQYLHGKYRLHSINSTYTVNMMDKYYIRDKFPADNK